MSEIEKFKCIGYMVGRSRVGGAEYVRLSDFDRVTADRDAALVDVERLDSALNVTDAAATKWLSDLTRARELFELILDDPRLVVAMSSDILAPIKSLLSGKPETFESKVSALQQRLTAADERADVLEGQLAARESELEEFATEMTLAITDSQIRSAMTVIGRSRFLQLLQAYNARIDAELKPAEGGSDA